MKVWKGLLIEADSVSADLHGRWNHVNQCFPIGQTSSRTHILFTLLSLQGSTLKAESLTWLFLLMSPPIKCFVAHTDGLGNTRLAPDRRELHSAPVQTVTSAIDPAAPRAPYFVPICPATARATEDPDIFIDIKIMNTNTSASDTLSRDAINAFLLDFQWRKRPNLNRSKISMHCA